MRPIKVFLVLASLWVTVPSQAASDLEGLWILSGQRSIVESELKLTPQGLELQKAYDLLVDDPSLQCIPASLTRVWSNPNSTFQIRFEDEQVLIDYELFDLRRQIPLNATFKAEFPPSTRNLKGEIFPTMGSSIARWNEDRLQVETRGYAQGYLKTSTGLPQSPSTSSIEEFWREGEFLKMKITFTDPELFAAPFSMEYRFAPSPDDNVMPYGCEPESAGYEWFENLNKPATEP